VITEHALSEASLLDAVSALAERDPALAASVERFGPPPLWDREPSFATLVHLILEQQVSLDGDVSPAAFLELDDGALRAIGFSRQKAGYAGDLAVALVEGLDLAALERLDDDEVRVRLMTLRGIGRWTADVYLTMCLRRPDVWPNGDLALAVGAMELLELPSRPTDDELREIAERWHPYRAVAARIVWHHYLGVRGRS
jgi:DNA-3-methyladenine glycosylase II